MTDWLNTYPLPLEPDGWALNPIFLQKIREVEKLWARHGYEWKFGIELEFNPIPTEQAQKIIDEATETQLEKVGSGVSLSGLLLTERLLDHVNKTKPDDQIYTDTLNTLRDYFRNNPDGAQLLQETSKTLDEVLADIDSFARDLKSEDPDKAFNAKRNIFLAFIHTTPFSEGGVRDIVEPRWGKAQYGIGWYDVRGPEIRTSVIDGALSAVEQSYKMLESLKQQSLRFGLPLDGNHFSQQIHFSIWRISDGKNMLDMQDEESKQFCERALTGYYDALKSMPFTLENFEDYHGRTFIAGVSRLSDFRIKQGDWEDRQTRTLLQGPISGQILSIMAGSAWGCLNDDKYESIGHRVDEVLSIERQTYPVSEHRNGDPLSGLAMAINYCKIKLDGSLEPDTNAIECILWRLKEEIGEGNLDAYIIDESERENIYFNLAHPAPWIEVIKKLKIKPDNQLDTSAIEDIPVLAEAFGNLVITDRRTALLTQGAPVRNHIRHTPDLLKNFFFSDFAQEFFTPYERSEMVRVYSDMAMQSQAFIRGKELSHTLKYVEKQKKNKQDGDEIHSRFSFASMYTLLSLHGNYISHLINHTHTSLDSGLRAIKKPSEPSGNLACDQFNAFTEEMRMIDIRAENIAVIPPRFWEAAEMHAVEHLATTFSQAAEKTLSDILNGDYIRKHGPHAERIFTVCDQDQSTLIAAFRTVVEDTSDPEDYAFIFLDAAREHLGKAFDEFDDKPETQKLGELSRFVYKVYKIQVSAALQRVEEWAKENIPQAQTDQEQKPVMQPA